MSKAIDLTEQQFGYLTVISATDKRDGTGSIIWKCQCVCNEITYASSRALRSGSKTSCGCKKKERAPNLKRRDLKDQRFANLVAIRPLEERIDGSIIWECRCDCGNVVNVSAKSLTSGNTKSCGCRNIEVARRRAREKASADCVAGTRLSYLTQTVFSHNTSGIRGVCYHKKAGKWIASINFQKKTYYLGCYDHKEEAEKARKAAEDLLWGPFLEEHIGPFKNEEERKEKLRAYLEEKISEELQYETEN